MYIGIHDEYNHCLEDCLLTYLLQNGIPYCYMYADSWRFFSDVDSLEGFGGTEYNCTFPHEDAVNKILHIQKIDLDTPSLMELETYLKENQFVGIHYDAYYCDWSIAFQKYHMQHYFILNRICDQGLKGSDPYLNRKKVDLSYNKLLNNQGQFFLLLGGHVELDWREIIKYVSDVNEEMFIAMRQFGYNMEKIDINEYGKKYCKDITSCTLYHNITYVVNSRFNLTKLFYYLAGKVRNTHLENVAEEFWNIAKTWESIKGEIIKMMISDAFYRKRRTKIKERVWMLAEREEDLLNNIKQFDKGRFNG